MRHTPGVQLLQTVREPQRVLKIKIPVQFRVKPGGIFVCCVFESVDSRTGYTVGVSCDEQQTDNSAGNEIGGSQIFYSHSQHLFFLRKKHSAILRLFLLGVMFAVLR